MIAYFHQIINRAYGVFRTNIASTKIKIQPIHGPCLLLGSAPNPSVPVGFDKGWVLITVNASQTSVKSWNVQPNLTVTSDYMLGDTPANIAAKEAIRNNKTGRLILIERKRSVAETKKILQILNYQYDELIAIDHWERSRIAHRILGKYVATGSGEEIISTGVFAALMAYFLGADPVVLSGFSFSINGHAYNTYKHKRSHVSVDRAALSLAREKRLPFYTANNKFSLESGLPEWKG
jgi:hypothetical protein